MILEVTLIILVVILAAVIINGIEDYHTREDKIGMSFKESMDLTDLPIITFYNNGKKFNFLLDTGASVSVIDSNILGNLKHEKSNEHGILFGLEGNEVDVSYIKTSLEYKGVEYEDDFQVIDMSAPFSKVKAESGVTLSGILSSTFFKKYKYILDFERLVAYSKK